jgi:two-component system chemotaxis response regulator CheB
MFSPSVDHLFFSAVDHARCVVATILTGIGDDGAEGMLALSKHGARTIGQNEQSCVVFGMPKAAMARGAVQHEGNPTEIASLMIKNARNHRYREYR